MTDTPTHHPPLKICPIPANWDKFSFWCVSNGGTKLWIKIDWDNLSINVLHNDNYQSCSCHTRPLLSIVLFALPCSCLEIGTEKNTSVNVIETFCNNNTFVLFSKHLVSSNNISYWLSPINIYKQKLSCVR